MDRSRPTHTPVCDSVLFCSKFLTSISTASLQISTKEELSCRQCSNASIQVLFTEWNCRSEHRKGRLRFFATQILGCGDTKQSSASLLQMQSYFQFCILGIQLKKSGSMQVNIHHLTMTIILFQHVQSLISTLFFYFF